MINYYLLIKPGIIFGNLLTFAAGYLLASKGQMEWQLFFSTLLGLGLIMASACTFNNYIDRHIDLKMKRTKKRAIATGAISHVSALIFGTVLGLLGAAVLYLFTNALALSIAVAGFVVYVVLYSMWKCHTVYGTAIGSIAGAIPPVVGYCAVSHHLDAGAAILFAMLVLWQMPHFFAIALFHLDDYAAASIPALPLTKGIFRTKIHMVIYIGAFIVAAAMLTVFNYTGMLYLVVALTMGMVWLALGAFGFAASNSEYWGKLMFRFSLILITCLCIVIPLDVVVRH